MCGDCGADNSSQLIVANFRHTRNCRLLHPAQKRAASYEASFGNGGSMLTSKMRIHCHVVELRFHTTVQVEAVEPRLREPIHGHVDLLLIVHLS